MDAPAKTHNCSNSYFLIAFGLISILAYALLLSGISFLLGFTILAWQFPVACIAGLVSTYFAAMFFHNKDGKRVFFKTGGVIIVSIVALVLIAGAFYDISYDGQWYHQETVFRLKQGYNPAKQMLSIPQDEANNTDCPVWCTGPDPVKGYIKPTKPIVNLKFLAINYFSKGSEIVAASIYSLTDRIETGKAVNGILLLASFFLCLSLLYQLDSIGPLKKWLIAALLAFNPIAVTQVFTFCVDGNVASLLLCLLVISFMIFRQMNKYYLFMLMAIILLVVNIKFTSLIFAGIYCVGLLFVLLIYKKVAAFKKVLIAGAISAVIGVLICGFNPYVTNIISKKNVFYGTDDVRNETERIMPALFKDHNSMESLAMSLFSHQGWHAADKGTVEHVFKIPFTVNKQDIIDAKDPQQELSGFGPFFSGILILSIIAYVIVLVGYRKTTVFKYATGAIVVVLFTVVITPYSWWARYVPQFWLIPVIVLCMVEIVYTNGKKILKSLLYFFLVLNVAWGLLSIVSNIFDTVHINYQMRQLKALNAPVIIKFCMYETFKSNLIRFEEWGIPTTEGDVAGKYIYNVDGSSTRFETQKALPDLPKPFTVKLSERIKGKH